jgi:hypothetical protein
LSKGTVDRPTCDTSPGYSQQQPLHHSILSANPHLHSLNNNHILLSHR